MEHSISRVCNCKPGGVEGFWEIHIYCVTFTGYTGLDCEIEINECVPDPCEHGFCHDLISDYDCLCEKGWTGKNCEIDIDDCMEKPCQNGGYCNDLLNDYQCQCPPVYKGKNCEIDINECEANPCQVRYFFYLNFFTHKLFPEWRWLCESCSWLLLHLQSWILWHSLWDQHWWLQELFKQITPTAWHLQIRSNNLYHDLDFWQNQVSHWTKYILHRYLINQRLNSTLSIYNLKCHWCHNHLYSVVF